MQLCFRQTGPHRDLVDEGGLICKNYVFRRELIRGVAFPRWGFFTANINAKLRYRDLVEQICYFYPTGILLQGLRSQE